MIEILESRRHLSSGTLALANLNPVVATNPPPATVSSGKLDLTNNKLVVSTNPLPQTVGSYTGVTGIITSNPGNTATQQPNLTTLTVAGTFAGQSVNPGDTLVMYTYAGDANLDGTIDASDYNQINGGSDADFNYDGKINADDYFVIDKNYSNQANDNSNLNLNLGGVFAVGIGSQNAVGGTDGNDRIIVTWANADASVPGGAEGHFTIKRNHNTILTTSTELTIDAKGGDDYVSVSVPDGADVKVSIYGGAGNDTIIGGAESDRIYAGDGNDVISAGDGKDSIYGEAGDDSIRGGGSNDLIDGGDGNDTLRGDAGNDNIAGGANSDRLRGSLGNDTLDGGGGRDFLAGEDGDDSLIGGAGDDVCDGGAGINNLNGGSGHDQIYVNPSDHCDDQEQNDGEIVNVVDMINTRG